MLPLDDPEPRLPGVLVLEPLDVPPLIEPLLDEPVPSEPVLGLVVLDVPPAPLVLAPCSCRQRSFSSPVSELHRAESEPVAPTEDPLTPVEGVEDEPMLLPVEPEGEVVLLEPEGEVVLLEPTEGELVLLPTPLAPVLPLVPPEVCANADIANSAAAVAETMSFRFISAPS